MSHGTYRLPGPDFLDSLADEAQAHDLLMNASEFRERAREWRADQQRIDALEATVAKHERARRTIAERYLEISELHARLKAANDLLPDTASKAG